MFCPSCGVESTTKTNYCKSCGANLNQPGNTVEVHIARPPIAAMTISIAAFGIIGFIASLITLDEMTEREIKDNDVVIATFFFCLMFLILVVGVLSWQLGRLISTYRETIRRTVENEKAEIATPSQPVLPQRQHSYMPPAQEPVSGVTENTTRTFSS
jgi:hypothetical protein